MNIKAIYRIVISSLVLCVLSLEISSAMHYRTDLLERMAEGMQMKEQIESLGEGEHFGTLSFRGLPLSIRIRNNEVCHIGHLVFTKTYRDQNPLPIYDFIERYTLEVRIPYDRIKPVEKQIEEDEIIFAAGSFELLCDMYEVQDIEIVRLDDKYYSVTWSSDGNVLCSMAFRNSYELLNGSDMLENERRLPQNLRSHKPSTAKQDSVSREDLVATWMKNCFILPGDSYYTDQMTSNLYYERIDEDSDAFRLLYNSVFPIESLANLFCTTEIDNDITLDINYRKYGFQGESFKVTLRQWTDYCIQEGCIPFFGILEDNEDLMVCSVIMKNNDCGYLHTLRVEVPRGVIKEPKGEIKARLVSFIPHSRIKNLFEETGN